ncbi:MAG TPA: hypothetical protein PLO37_04850 [Candidatus Hydrogenedentes bacterium]|nr:hypothetical protein [Candidatus Hydrogenedentota bacterium]HPG66153.1 hypothetical protein [Candidatus Hydrogenedentota bacterium]
MARNRSFFLVLLAGGVGMALALCASASIPLMINHQGAVQVAGTSYTGTGFFRFAFIEASSGNNLWTNDGSNLGAAGMPTSPVSLVVDEGLYSVQLGDVGIPGMALLSSAVFNSDDVRLRIWFDDGTHGAQQLVPDQPVTSVAYAYRSLFADQASNADLIDGRDSTAFAEATHDHPLYSLSGTLNDAQIPDDITVNYAAAAGNADTLDGMHAAAFMPATTDLWVDTAGDTMTGSLTVEETVTAPAYAFPSEQTQFFSIPSAAFVRASNSVNCYIDNGSVSGSVSGTAVQVLAPFNLPNGARLVGYKVNCRALDASFQLQVKLLRQPDSGSMLITNSTLTVAGTGGNTTLFSPALDVTIDNEDYAYLVQADWVTPPTATDTKLYNVHIQYSVTGLRP